MTEKEFESWITVGKELSRAPYRNWSMVRLIAEKGRLTKMAEEIEDLIRDINREMQQRRISG